MVICSDDLAVNTAMQQLIHRAHMGQTEGL